MLIRNEKGVVLVISFIVVMVLLILGSIFIFRTLTEKNMSDRERFSTQAFYAADGGNQEGINKLNTLINTDMMTTVNMTNPQVLANDAEGYVTASDGLGFLIAYCKIGGTAQFILNGSEAIYTGDMTSLDSGTYRNQIKIQEKGNPVTVSVDVWDFPYSYRIETTGTASGVSRKIALTGDFTVRVQRDNFAKFALFTDHHTMPSGTVVWFTNKTNFAGPIHTNERYSFAFNPSGVFDGVVTQHLQQARFYNLGSPILEDADYNETRDVPTFNERYTRSTDEIVLASSVQKDDLEEQATGDTSIVGDGIFIPHNGTDLVGGIFVRGNAAISMSVDTDDNAVYAITEGGTTKIVTVDKVNNQTSVETVGGGTDVYNGQPDGINNLGTIIYVDGEVSSLGGTVQKDTEVTISSEREIVITDHVRYSEYTPASGTPGQASYVPPNADGKKNLLGLVSWGDNVRVATTAPDDINIHGIVMARNGVFQVDDYNDIGAGPRGAATLLGGAITQFYGAFGLFNGTTGALISGYGRNFIYDGRMLAGKSPPYFPSMRTFIAFTNDLTDKLAWKEGGF